MSLSRDEVSQVRWAWKDKGDPSDCSDWDAISAKCPELRKVYQDWKTAERIMSLVIRGLEDDCVEDEE